MTPNDEEKSAQIPPIHWPKQLQSDIKDNEVMVVLLNMGGPRTNADVRPFLKRLFSDSIIMRMPCSAVLQPIFAWLIVTLRGKRTEERYQLIGGGSPLFDSTGKQTQALQAELQRRGRTLEVIFSFNYAPPFPAETIAEIKAKGKKYILPLSLYPHYSSATTGSNMYYLEKEAKKNYPDLQFLELPSYYLHPKYIQAFVDRIREAIISLENLDEYFLLFSAHGLPLYFLMEGDPYPFQIAQTVAAVLGKLNRQHGWSISYQSSVGPLKWLKPSTDDMLKALARRGVRKLLVVPIAFVNDHIETLCEIDMEYRKLAEEAGIEDYRMTRALEVHPAFIEALADSVEDVIPGEKKRVNFLKGTALGDVIEKTIQIVSLKNNL